jgi:proline dehydrogenase
MGLLMRFAAQWVAGETLEDAVRVAKDANARGLEALVNHLGEHYREKPPVEATMREYLRLLATIRDEGVRGTVSIKPTQFGVLIDKTYALSQILPVLDATKADRRVLWLDMENATTTDGTIWIYERLLERHDRVGICLQANLRRTPNDMDRLLELGARVRLVKGAYKETEEIAYRKRSEIDRAYLANLETLFARGREFAVGSHDGRIIQRALELAREHPTPFEFAMLQGVRDPLKRELVSKGHRVAEYIPYGPNWLPYFSRRLRARPRNIITMARSFVSG